jgi:hypothetical protein
LRTRHPFADVELGYFGSMGDGMTEGQAQEFVPGAVKPLHHPDAVEKGAEYALGFMPHRDMNRKARRSAVANFEEKGVDRRELWRQRQQQRRGKLDPELRRLQRKALKNA